MPRPTDESLTSAPSSGGFGADPNASSSFGSIEVSPVHQLDVDGATENAHALAAVFAKGADLADTVIKQKNDAADAQGYLDGSVGAVNVSAQSSISANAYAAGAKRAQTQMTAITAANQAKQFFAAHPDMPLTDSTDENGQTVKGLMSNVDDIFKQAFPGGAEQDPVVAKLIGPLVQHTFNEITGASYQASIQSTQQGAEDAQTALAVHDAQNPGGGLFNVQQSLDTMTKVFGGDARKGREALVQSVGEAAVQSGQPGLIDRLLPNGLDLGNGATLTPQNLAYLDGARNRATAAAQKTNEQALKSAGMAVVQAIGAGKDPSATLDAYSKMPGADPNFYRSQLDWFRSQGADNASRAINTGDAADLQASIASGSITSVEQAQQFVAARGYKAGAAVDLMTHAGSWLSAVQHTNQDDPQFRAQQDRLNELYHTIDPLTGQWTSVDSKMQHANVMLSYVTNYTQAVQQGTAPAQAAQQAADKAQKQWGDPKSQTDAQQKMPTDNYSAAAYIRNSANRTPSALKAAGIDGTRIKTLRDANLLSADEANAAATALLTQSGK
jgi:hypothetical protein